MAANDYGALGSAIYTLVDSATTLGVYNERAPQGSVPAYVVFQRQDANDTHTFTSSGVAADYVVKVVSNAYWPGSAQFTYDTIHRAIDGNLGSVNGFTLQRFERQATIQYQEPSGFWHVGGIYRVEVTEA